MKLIVASSPDTVIGSPPAPVLDVFRSVELPEGGTLDVSLRIRSRTPRPVGMYLSDVVWLVRTEEDHTDLHSIDIPFTLLGRLNQWLL